jgi:hypothetical protein
MKQVAARCNNFKQCHGREDAQKDAEPDKAF